MTRVSRQHDGLIFKGPNVHAEWTLEDGTSTLSRNVGDHSPREMCHTQKKRRPELISLTDDDDDDDDDDDECHDNSTQ